MRVPERGGNVAGIDALDDEGARAASERRADVVVRRGRREHHDLDVRMVDPQQVDAAASVLAPHPQLQRDDLGPAPLDQCQDLRAGMGGADDLDVLDGFQRAPEALEHETVVVSNQYAHSAIPSLSHPSVMPPARCQALVLCSTWPSSAADVTREPCGHRPGPPAATRSRLPWSMDVIGILARI